MTLRQRARLILILPLALLTVFTLLPFQLLGLVLVTPLARWVPYLFHRIIAFLFDVRIEIEGELSRSRPLMLVANHVSWLDIIVLSAVAPVSFIAKAEMRTWPLFGQLAWLQRTIFVRREQRRQSANQANEIAERLSAHDIIVLFPEGTTTDGHQLAPFKTTLFEAARLAVQSSDVEEAVVQPVALVYDRIHGLPMGRLWRQHVAWPGAVGLGEHFLPLIATGALNVRVIMGDPIMLKAESKRKIVSARCVEAIRTMSRRPPLDSAVGER